MIQEITFKSGENTLCGTLYTPDTSGKHPAMAFLVGSGAESGSEGDAWGFKMWVTLAEHCAARGIAVLLFDKPGLGKSTGDWSKQTFDDRADDGLAAIQYLKSLPQIDNNNTGLIGHSQGGWITQLAASRSAEVSFIITLAGPYISVYDQIMMDRSGHLSIENASKLKTALTMISIKSQLHLAKIAAVLGYRHPITYIMDFDPADILPDITCPVLALFGEKDVLCHPEPSIAAINKHLLPDQTTYKIFTDCNHLFWKCETGSTKEFYKLQKEFHPDFLNTISNWITAREK
ncbi:alpha/beta hydrolase family protein [Fictibacillus aquaticus]|nr:alpha/beta fold hydrolase [Fictibacillus aquaticus]